MKACRQCLGFTLVEVIVVLVLLGILSSVASLAFASLGGDDVGDSRPADLRAGQRTAVTGGRPYRVIADSAGGAILFLPDGRAIGPGVAPLTGRVVEEGS